MRNCITAGKLENYLDGVRVKDLHGSGKFDLMDYRIDALVPNVVCENEQGGLAETRNGLETVKEVGEIF